MSVKTITPTAVALCYDGSEPHPDLSRTSVYQMINSLLSEKGLPAWPDMEVDVFSGSINELMLIARPAPEPDICIIFSCLDDLIDAANSCAREAPSSLIYIDGSYLLFIASCGEYTGFLEFGKAVRCSIRLRTHAEEHGTVLIGHHAISLLKTYFK